MKEITVKEGSSNMENKNKKERIKDKEQAKMLREEPVLSEEVRNTSIADDSQIQMEEATSVPTEAATAEIGAEEQDEMTDEMVKFPSETESQQPQQTPMEQNFLPVNDSANNNFAGNDLKTVLQRDIATIKMLVQTGRLDPLQGQNLMNQVINKAYEMLLQGGVQAQSFQPGAVSTPYINRNQAFFDFEKEQPEFFNSSGRNEVLNYLRSSNAIVDKDELLKISSLIEQVEKNAINDYLKKNAHEENLKKLNEAAKSRLKANAQKSNGGKNDSQIFTRERIGKMSGAEFAKYEKLIMNQLKKGLIR